MTIIDKHMGGGITSTISSKIFLFHISASVLLGSILLDISIFNGNFIQKR